MKIHRSELKDFEITEEKPFELQPFNVMDKHSDDIHVSELDIIMYRYIGLINILNNYKYNYIDEYT